MEPDDAALRSLTTSFMAPSMPRVDATLIISGMDARGAMRSFSPPSPAQRSDTACVRYWESSAPRANLDSRTALDDDLVGSLL